MLVILSGVSGAGKDTIKKELIKRMENVISLPSFTSRKPREGEEEGVQYHFITKEQFKEKIKNNEFYEYDLHHENYYGTSRKLLNEKIQSGKIIVKDIEVNGTENLVKLLKEDTKIVTIFLKVDKDELRRRLEIINVDDEYATRRDSAKILSKTLIILIPIMTASIILAQLLIIINNINF